MEKAYEELARKIRIKRFENNISQDKIALELKVSVNTYRAWEKNPKQLNLENLISISKILDFNLIEFFLPLVLQNAIKENNKTKEKEAV